MTSNTIAFTAIGTATVLLEIAGLRLLTDPVLDAPGVEHHVLPWPFRHLTRYRRLTAPALTVEQLGHIDLVLLSHDHHADNLDATGRALLRRVPQVLTTPVGARRLRRQGLAHVRGLKPGDQVKFGELRIIAAPAQHGPAHLEWLSGPVTGFHLEWGKVAVSVSGDTRWHPALEAFTRAHPANLALVHAGAARFPLSGRSRFSATAKELLAWAKAWPQARIVPIHCDGWSHFTQGLEEIEATFRGSPHAGQLLVAPRGVRIEHTL